MNHCSKGSYCRKSKSVEPNREGKYLHDYKSIADSGTTGELPLPLLDKEDTQLEHLSPEAPILWAFQLQNPVLTKQHLSTVLLSSRTPKSQSTGPQYVSSALEVLIHNGIISSS